LWQRKPSGRETVDVMVLLQHGGAMPGRNALF
jgi:hypothetical protein